MRVVRDSQRFTLQPQAGTASQVELDGDRLVAHDAAESAKLIVHGGERCSQVAIIGSTLGDRNRRGWRDRSGLQKSRRRAGKPFSSGHLFSLPNRDRGADERKET